ncbi:transposase [Lonsdalea quercina]|uniref:transposase n=1 Tax=Lonsdalea quercina TaxID=71657 RepID=UPI003975EFA4
MLPLSEVADTPSKTLMASWEQIVKRISPERKSAALAKLLQHYNMTVTAVAQMDGVSKATLRYWSSKAKTEGNLVPGADKTTDLWSAEVRLVGLSAPPRSVCSPPSI